MYIICITISNEIIINRNFNIFFLLYSRLSYSPYCVETPVLEAVYYFSAFGAILLGGNGYLNHLAVSMLCLRSSFRVSV